MEIKTIEIGNKKFNLYYIDIAVQGKIAVAEYALNDYIEELIESNRYTEVTDIDNLFEYYLPSDYDGDYSEESIKECIEPVALMFVDFRELNKDDLWELRQSIDIDSKYAISYRSDKYAFNPADLMAFFKGYLNYISKIANEKNETKHYTNYDNSENLWDWFEKSRDLGVVVLKCN